jgi:hypothetical protein
MKKPNFFIIGAPKCGTTSLAHWLAEHPNIYMPKVKEPHHFNTDDNHLVYKNRDDYESLFSNVSEMHYAIGEASVWYLYSSQAVKNIEQYNPLAKYIVCIRNPIEMAYSLHEQQVVNCNEDIIDFTDAWRVQLQREQGQNISKWTMEPSHLLYGKVCSLGWQLERLYEKVDSNRILIVLLDDMKQAPSKEYAKILSFLGVENDGRNEFPVLNAAKESRSVLLKKIVRLLGGIKKKLNINRGLGILKAIDRKNIRYRDRKPMSRDMRLELEKYFTNDIKIIEKLINRDLSHWMNLEKRDV